MANLTPDEIIEAIADILRDVPDIGVVVTDPRFTSDEADLYAVVANEHKEGIPEGVVIIWDDTTDAQEATDCDVAVTRTFKASFLGEYKNDGPEGETSDKRFKRRCFLAEEAISGSDSLGLDTSKMIFGRNPMIGETPFVVVDWNQDSSHFKVYNIPVSLRNFYG